MINVVIIILSILIMFVGYQNAECDKCRHEAVLFGLLFLLFINHGIYWDKISYTIFSR